MSNMLIYDRPIMFLPLLAKALGGCEKAIVLQQIHWLSHQPNSGVWQDGYHWVWGTYEEWCRDYFMMWSAATLKYHIKKLEEQGVLISAQLRAHQHDQTKFYRINYPHELLNPTGNRQHVIDSNGQGVPPSSEQDVVDSIYRTKTSTESAAKKEKRPTPAQQKRSYQPEDYPEL